MKKLFILGLFVMSLGCVQFVQAQTVDEVIDKYITAMGGKEKLSSLKTVRMNGSMNVQGFEIGVVLTVSQGIGSRTDISVPQMGDGFQIMTPTKGWNFMPFQGQAAPEEVSEEEVQIGQNSLDLQSPLLNYKEKGNKVELLGKEKVEGTDCFKLKLTNKFGKETIFFIDTTNYYRIKSIGKAVVNGVSTDVETIYSDYKKDAGGYVFPYSLTNARGTISFSSIETNIPIDEKIFRIN